MSDQKLLLPAQIRYLGAWQEINQRLGIRAQINTYHISAILALAGAYVAIQSPGSDPKVRHLVGFDSHLIPALLMPLTSFIFVLWYRHNDTIIGLLSLYCKTMEKVDFEQDNAIPAWFYAPPVPEHLKGQYSGIQTQALQARTLSDLATIMICLLSPTFVVIEFFKFLINISQDIAHFLIYFFIYAIFLLPSIIICSILIFWLGILPGRRRQVLIHASYHPNLGLWNYSIEDIVTIYIIKFVAVIRKCFVFTTNLLQRAYAWLRSKQR